MKPYIVPVAAGILAVAIGCTERNGGITMPGPGFETVGEPYLLFKYPATPGDSYTLQDGSTEPDEMQVLSIDSQISVPDGPHSCYSYEQRSSQLIDAPIFNYHLAPFVGFARQEMVDTLGDHYFIVIWELEGIDIMIDAARKQQPSQTIMPLHIGWRWRGTQTSIIDDDTVSLSLNYIIADTLRIDDEKWYLFKLEHTDRKSAQLKGKYPIYANRTDGLWRWSVKFD
jgi:hypothetical protein